MIKPLDLTLDYKVADISLADFGKKEMQLSERETPAVSYTHLTLPTTERV